MANIGKRNYQNGKIYCIRNYVDDEVYVGSTTQALSKRMERHRGNLNGKKCWNYRLYQKMREIGREHFYIELIEKYECKDVEELRKKEGEWIRKIGTINQEIAGRTRAEYLIDKKDELKEQQKGYREEHKEEKREYDKKHREDKREDISEYWKEKYANNLEYQEQVKQRSAQRYENKKTEIRAKMNTKCECQCGKTYTYGNRQRHFNSNHHQQYLQQQEN